MPTYSDNKINTDSDYDVNEVTLDDLNFSKAKGSGSFVGSNDILSPSNSFLPDLKIEDVLVKKR